MKPAPNSEPAGRAILDRLGIAEDPLIAADPVSFLRSLVSAGTALARNPTGVAAANTRLAIGVAAAARAAAMRALGSDTPGPVSPAAGDKRFADPAYDDNPLYFLLEQQYLLTCQLASELLDAAGLDAKRDNKARFAAKFLLDALAPTNTLPGNPAALREAVSTRGRSLVAGAKNLLGDVRHNGGWPAQVDAEGFEVGVNMAATPGSVVYRSDLIELIQYEPQEKRVHAVPLLFCPPWINKYYIMDLAPGKSLIEWAVQHGHTVFAISYRNPDATMRDLGFADYLRQGPLDAVRVVREITGAPEVNTVSVCLGGTLTAIGLAHNAAVGDTSIKSATFLNTLTDFSVPGSLGIFTDEATIAGLEKQMAKKGFLDSDKMAHTFDALRANDLVFSYVVNNWLLGKKPPAFDLLVWNKDSTRMPAKMHSQYLRSCYLHNEFARGEFELDGEKLQPQKVEIDTYVLAAVDDHIVPWVSGYQTTQLLGGHNRFVLSTSGHIAGIVNPPGPKPKHWTNDSLPADPQEWKANAELQDGTWWEDWATWIAKQGGPKVAARRQLGSKDHPPIEPAPGSYVRVRA
ncbi:MAG: poly[(R)-3-hydroxyalkanoate] polymerase subunit PhaC [Frankiaceae bacterium]|nr:poly[(R)-3-hydroxyalkanoate] polymerase subunit PhaC [Frankiaceae bacterium]